MWFFANVPAPPLHVRKHASERVRIDGQKVAGATTCFDQLRFHQRGDGGGSDGHVSDANGTIS